MPRRRQRASYRNFAGNGRGIARQIGPPRAKRQITNGTVSGTGCWLSRPASSQIWEQYSCSVLAGTQITLPSMSAAIYPGYGGTCSAVTWTPQLNYGTSAVPGLTVTISPSVTGSTTSCGRVDTVTVSITASSGLPATFDDVNYNIEGSFTYCALPNSCGSAATVIAADIWIGPGPLINIRLMDNVTSQDISWDQVSKVIGQYNSLTAYTTDNSPLEYCEWGIPGYSSTPASTQVIATYNEGPKSATVTYLPSTITYDGPTTVDFYWVMGQAQNSNLQVSCYDPTEIGWETVAAFFTVEAPTLGTLSAQPTPVPNTLNVFQDPGSGDWFMHYGPPSIATNLAMGITFSGSFTMPQDYAGYIVDTQTIVGDTNVTLIPGATASPPALQETGTATWLDTCEMMPVDPSGALDTTRNISFVAAAPASFPAGDGPQDGLANDEAEFVDNSSFTDYVRFRPNGFGATSIWVPVAVITWNYYGDAVQNLNTGTFSLASDSAWTNATVTGSPQPTGSASQIPMPTWSGLWSENYPCQAMPTN
jgi:hypothetical protein